MKCVSVSWARIDPCADPPLLIPCSVPLGSSQPLHDLVYPSESEGNDTEMTALLNLTFKIIFHVFFYADILSKFVGDRSYQFCNIWYYLIRAVVVL